MKLAITQIVLGALALVSSLFTAAWYFPSLIPPLPIETASEAGRRITYIAAVASYYQEHWFIIYGWMLAVVLLGLAVVGYGIAYYWQVKRQAVDEEKQTGVKNLAIAQIVLGAFTAAASFVTALWYQSVLFPSRII